ncbi:MAG: DNA polymerase III subunit delta, partial [Muribaculaceae bacterium]|nr:DNA polymerase III subunit delta [Muribaculaceae bacterium]
IIPTIYSRCQRIEVKRLSDDVVAGCLTAGFAVDPAEAMSVAHVAEGSMVRAIVAIKAGSESQRHLDLFMRLMRLAYMRDVKKLKEWSATTAKLSREELLSFLTYCERMVRENFILNLHDTRLNYLNSAEAAFSAKFSPFINERNVMKIIEVLNEAVADVSGNANARIVLFDVAIKMILLIKQ